MKKKSQQFPKAVFRSSRSGLATVLGDLEAAVMEYVWRRSPEAISARQLDDAIGARRGVQYITLVTVLNNLWKKGLLLRTKAGRAYVYVPKLEREEFLSRVARDVFNGVIRLGPDAAVNSFVEALEELAPEELERLKERLADSRKRERDELRRKGTDE